MRIIGMALGLLMGMIGTFVGFWILLYFLSLGELP